MSRYSKFPQGFDEKMPMPPSIKNDIVLTPNHENLHANSSKQPFALVVDSRDRNYELYPNPNNYVIQIPRYKDVLSVELTGADVPHSGFNVDNSCNTLYIAFTQDMFINYYNGVRQNGVSYIEVVIPPGFYEASDFVSNTGALGTLNYENYYNSAPVNYIENTGILAKALKLAVIGTPYAAADFYVIFNYKTLKYVIVSDWAFAILNRDTDKNTSNQPIPNFYVSQGVNVYNNPITYYNTPPTPAQANDSYLGDNNDRFTPLPNSIYNVLGFKMKNYFPSGNLYKYQPAPIGAGNTLVDGAFSTTNSNYVQISQGQNYYWPPPYSVNYNTPYNSSNPCDASMTGLPLVAGPLVNYYVSYSLPDIVNLSGEKYIILDIPELNYRDITNSINNQFYCRILLDTNQNTVPLTAYYSNTATYPTTTNLSTHNTIKAIKSSDIGNNRCIKYFSPSQGVLSKLTIRWLKYDGTPYDFQGQDHTLGFELVTIKQTSTYYN
jgi:hypothetical protein